MFCNLKHLVDVILAYSNSKPVLCLGRIYTSRIKIYDCVRYNIYNSQDIAVF